MPKGVPNAKKVKQFIHSQYMAVDQAAYDVMMTVRYKKS